MEFQWLNTLNDRDAEEIVAIINAVASNEGTNGIPQPLTPGEAQEFTTALRGSIERRDCYQLVTRAGGCIVAIATLEPVKMNPARRHVVDVKRMAAAPEARGFGGYLLGGWRVILKKCRELECDIVNIDVSEDGPYRMWQKLGFRVWAKVPDYARVGARRLDGYYLSVYVDDAWQILNGFKHDSRAAKEQSVHVQGSSGQY